jgi:hypothetical protein
MMPEDVAPVALIESRILLVHGQRVLLDSDLAALYQVLTKNLNLAVPRNSCRFPEDFMFQLTPEETESLRLQIATSNVGRGGRRYRPYVFTEHGVAMLSSVLGSERAVQVNISPLLAHEHSRHSSQHDGPLPGPLHSRPTLTRCSPTPWPLPWRTPPLTR